MDGLTFSTPTGAFHPGLALALAIGLLIGVERGWRLREEEEGARVAGIRTFALLGLLGGLAGLQIAGGAVALAVILIGGAIGALLLGYGSEMRRTHKVSATSTLAAILTLALGTLATTGDMALASVGAGAVVILLAARTPLHHAIRLTSASDIKALLRLVLVVFVILPLLPDAAMGPFHALNPQRLWTVVVVTGAISFIGYMLVRWLGEQRGAMLTAAVGALVSSTAVTVDAARRAREGAPGAAAGAAVAIASTIMLIRSLVLVSLVAPFALGPFAALVSPGLAVSALASAILLYFSRAAPAPAGHGHPKPPGLGIALLFALSVAALSIASAWAQQSWGRGSGAILIALGGTADIDAAIAAVGALPPGSLPLETAALALAAPTLLNTLFKLALFGATGGWRRALPGASALTLIAAALLLPIAIAIA
jgi:uncharacterized membrane protein (DUF4010 family)